MAPTPSLTLTVTAPGGSPVDLSSHLAYSGCSATPNITQNFGRQGDTAVWPLVDEVLTTPNVLVVPESRIKVVDNVAGVTVFAGVVVKPTLLVDGPIRREWTLNCTDNTFYADNSIVHGTFIGLGVDDIVIALTQQANCGITAVKVSAGGFVAPGPQLASVVINYKSLSEAWKQLATLAGQSTPYGWYVDENLQLHFYDASTALDSGVTFTTSPTAAGNGSLTEGHYLGDGQSWGYTWDGASIRNRILVQGATQTVTTSTKNAPTDTFRADGVSTSWPLKYSLTGTPHLSVGGATKTVAVAQAGQSASGAWVFTQNSFGGWFLTASAPPAAGTTIKIWYNYLVPIVARANDTASQAAYTGPNGGVFAMYISDTSLTTVPMALARAQRERTEYAFAAETLSFTTTEEWMGWVRAGQVIGITNRFIPDSQNSYIPGLVNEPFLVVGNDVNWTYGGYRAMTITAVRL